MKDKDSKHNNQQVKQQDKNKIEAIFLKLRYTQDFRGQGATIPTPSEQVTKYSTVDLGKIPTSSTLH